MELNNNNNILEKKEDNNNKDRISEYNLREDPKFYQIVYLNNSFQNTLGLEATNIADFEFSLKYPNLDSYCLTLLYKLLMKKAVFKSNAKVCDYESNSKLNELLVKKILYFYKLYARYLVTKYNAVFSQELIEKDLEDYNKHENKIKEFSLMKSFSYTNENLGNDDDLKKLMTINLFRNLSGRNPFIDYKKIISDNNECNTSKEDNNIITIFFDDDINKETDNRNKNSDNLNNIYIENNVINVSKNHSNNTNNENNNNLYNSESSFEDDNLSKNRQNKNNISFTKNLNLKSILNFNVKDNNDYLIKFEKLDLKDKVELIYFFFKYSIEFSGRINYYKQEVKNNNKLPKKSNILGTLNENSNVLNLDINNTNTSCNQLFTPIHQINRPYDLGYDRFKNKYFTLPSTRSCCVFKNSYSNFNETSGKIYSKEGNIKVFLKTYSDIEKFLDELEKQKQNESYTEFCNKLYNLDSTIKDNNEDSYKIKTSEKSQRNKKKLNNINKNVLNNNVKMSYSSDINNLLNLDDPLHELIKNIKDLLLQFKEYDEEEKKRQSNLTKKLLVSNSNNINSKELMLMSINEHVTTRRQLNKLKEHNNIYKKDQNNDIANENNKLTFDEIKQLKIEQQKNDRAKRMRERNKTNDNFYGNASNNLRQHTRRKRNTYKYNEEDYKDNSNNESEDNYSVYDDNEEISLSEENNLIKNNEKNTIIKQVISNKSDCKSNKIEFSQDNKGKICLYL